MAEEIAVTRVTTLEKFLKAEGDKKYGTAAVEVLLTELGRITQEIDRMAEEEAERKGGNSLAGGPPCPLLRPGPRGSCSDRATVSSARVRTGPTSALPDESADSGRHGRRGRC